MYRYIFIQIGEWEEEISNLKSELENKDKKHQEEIRKLESSHKDKMYKAECQLVLKDEEIRKMQDQLVETSQTDSDKLWQKNQSHKNLSSHLFQPSNLSCAGGPQSLPSEMLSEAQREVRRLQELRRYIQEECDQLLLRKERLREEVVWHAEHNYHQSSGLLSTHNNSISNNYGQMDVWQLNSRKLESQVTCMQNCPSSL